jgi:prepilin-type N-terminal cleavage/methylation domain-containing protein
MMVIDSHHNHLSKQSHANANEIASVEARSQKRRLLSRNDAKAFIKNQTHSRRPEFSSGSHGSSLLAIPITLFSNIRRLLLILKTDLAYRDRVTSLVTSAVPFVFRKGRGGVRRIVSNKLQLQPAFTLAEVLITLGIIGIIAEITIPTLVQNIQTQSMKAAYKVAYSELAQATVEITTDSSGSLVGVFTDRTTAVNMYSQKLKVIKTCIDPSGNWTCPMSSGLNHIQSVITLANGAQIGISAIDTNCNDSSWGLANFGQNLCTEFYIDVNGDKKPNKAGEDYLWIGVAPSGKLVPGGSQGIINASYSCPNGIYCNSYLYLVQ